MALIRLLICYLLAFGARSVSSKPFEGTAIREQALFVEQESSNTEVAHLVNHSNHYDDIPETIDETTAAGALEHMINALDVMQLHFYELWIGTWPAAIDWTAAVLNTYVSAALETLAKSRGTSETDRRRYSRIINKYFSHNTAYYFGEDAFSIRNEAYDDMLWVVLGWLESIKFIHHRNESKGSWHGTQFIPGFSHRARIFWDIASHGWDTSLCEGGMIWNPYLLPYKNSITNQLSISASVGMYLYSPGDEIDFPFIASEIDSSGSLTQRPYDPKYLKAAINGYAWLKSSNMTNELGLYVDGFHIKGWGHNGGVGTGKCDERNEMVYTYNQGVILSGLRGLWEATGDPTYLDDGYKLVRNTIAATGWVWSGVPSSPIKMTHGWAGLGREGIMEELCDSSGRCSQDAQTFKGIYFQHLTQFCEPLPGIAMAPGRTYAASESLRRAHSSACRVFGKWAMHNAKAALRTRDEQGRFGMWWGQGTFAVDTRVALPDGAVDYRNKASLLSSGPWMSEEALQSSPRITDERPPGSGHRWLFSDNSSEKRKTPHQPLRDEFSMSDKDANDRGRGRTAETQGGGLSVLRSSCELSKSFFS